MKRVLYFVNKEFVAVARSVDSLPSNPAAQVWRLQYFLHSWYRSKVKIWLRRERTRAAGLAGGDSTDHATAMDSTLILNLHKIKTGNLV